MPAAAKEGAHTAATGRLRGWTARLIAHRSVALLVTLACAAGLCLSARPAAGMRLGVTTIAGLPADSQERVAAGAVAQGFQPGMLSPTQVILARTWQSGSYPTPPAAPAAPAGWPYAARPAAGSPAAGSPAAGSAVTDAPTADSPSSAPPASPTPVPGKAPEKVPVGRRMATIATSALAAMRFRRSSRQADPKQ